MNNILYSLIIAILSIPFSASAQFDTTQRIISSRHNAIDQLEKPHVILISIDGFRHDYIELHQANRLRKLSASGVRAASMIPSFPSITFPNHYTLVTGLYPAHHGLIGNSIYDPKLQRTYSMSKKDEVTDPVWYGGLPIWSLAEQHQLLTASFYWPGSEAPIGILNEPGIDLRPTYYYPYNELIPIHDRIRTVVSWLLMPPSKRPHFINFYLPEVDHAGHVFGPEAKETYDAVQLIDSVIYELTEAVAETGLAVNFMVVSDHGMTSIEKETIKQPATLDTSRFVIVNNGTYVSIHAKSNSFIKPALKALKREAKHYRVYTPNKLPRKYHFNKKDDRYNRLGDIVLLADPNYYFHFNPKTTANPGAHGYDPYQLKDMHAVFLAWGPAFRTDTNIDAFTNIHVYSLLTNMLGLNFDHEIDGDKRLIKKMLK